MSEIKQPHSSRSIENEFADVLEFMTEQISQRFENGVLKSLQVSTVNKFADSIKPDEKTLIAKKVKVRLADKTVTVRKEVQHSFTDEKGVVWERTEAVEETEQVPQYRTEYQYEEVLLSSFADAQGGNFATVLMKLSGVVRRKVLKQFNNERITALARDMLMKSDKRNKQQLYATVEKAIGINTQQLIQKEAMSETLNALTIETSQWVKKLRDETLEKMVNDTLFAMTNGQGLEQLMEQFKNIKEERKGHAKFLAHNQIQNFNSVTTKIRVQKLGITRAVWDTSGDESVRPSHAARDGKEFDLAEGCYSSIDGKYLIPGVDYNCRCVARYVVDEDE